MRRHRTITVAAAVAAFAVTWVVPVAVHAEPSHEQIMRLECEGIGAVEIEAPTSAHDSWSAARITGGGHLVPVSFEHRVYDDTAQVTLFDGTVTHAPAHGRQAPITCSSAQQARLGDIAPPGVVWPDGIEPTDSVTVSFIATAVLLP